MSGGPRALTIDLFGTLVDFSIERDETPLVRELLAEAGIDRPAEDVLAVWVQASLAERGRRPFRTVHEALVAGAREAARELEGAIEPERWADALEQLWIERPLRPDALEALARASQAGVRRAIVTNLDRHVLDAVLDRTGLDAHVDAAVCSEDARAYKPHPRPFRTALAEIGALPDDAVHVGDNPGEDRAGARATGMQCRIVDPQAVNLVEVVDAALATLRSD